MVATLHFAEPQARRDLATFLGRAARLEDGGVRLQVSSGVIAAWVPALRPQSILDASPVVLGMRVAAGRVADPATSDLVGDTYDVTVPIRGLLDRLARSQPEEASLPVPPERLRLAWAGIAPPRRGWRIVAALPGADLLAVAEQGIAQVAAAVPDGTGTLLAERARTEVWTRPLPVPGVASGPVAGVAFAAHALGFLAEDGVAQLSSAASWWRLSTARGHVLSRAPR